MKNKKAYKNMHKKEGEKMANTESQKKARERYNKTVKKVAADINNDVYNIMQQYCINNDFTKKEFLEKAILYYIDRH